MLLTSRYVIPVSSAFDTYIEYGAVLVEGDRIVEVGPAADLMARHPGEEVRDFGMAAIMPGFVDCHSHLEFSLMRGILNDTHQREDGLAYHQGLVRLRLHRCL